jgi:UDP-N-acetylglucosamine--N-acetylmuramyl-(pentapeptide) pyrophosphoryl-undecaprenol N-acetylglucosamine transferase
VYPGLTVIKALLDPKPSGSGLPTLERDDLLWIGSRGGIEAELVKHEDIEFIGLAAGGLRGKGLWVKARNGLRILGSVGRARGILDAFQPDVILVTGGYACVAVTLAGWMKNVPVVIYLPDIVPGQAIRFLSRFAAVVTVTSEESYHYFRREKVVVTGYPVRSEFYSLERAEAREKLGLELDAQTLLVFGGSRGSRSINQALVAALPELLPVCQIVHASGTLDADWVAGAAKRLPEEAIPSLSLPTGYGEGDGVGGSSCGTGRRLDTGRVAGGPATGPAGALSLLRTAPEPECRPHGAKWCGAAAAGCRSEGETGAYGSRSAG